MCQVELSVLTTMKRTGSRLSLVAGEGSSESTELCPVSDNHERMGSGLHMEAGQGPGESTDICVLS